MLLRHWVITASLCCQASYSQTGIEIVVAAGGGAINRVGRAVAKDPAVRIVDGNGRAVPGAAVSFLLPSSGPGAEFAGGQTSQVVTSGDDGIATASGLRANNVAGQFEIRVSASARGRRASSRITQTNVAPASEPKLLTGKRIVILAVVAGAVTGGLLAATSGGGREQGNPFSTPATGTVLAPGSPTIGPPR